MDSIIKANDPEENIDTYGKFIDSSINRKPATNGDKEDRFLMICIPDDDLQIKKENAESTSISVETVRNNVAVSGRDTEVFIQSNKMYVNEESSSSDSDDVHEIIASTKNPEKTLNILEKSGRTDILIKEHKNNEEDDVASGDDRLTIKYKNVPKNSDNMKVYL